MKSHRATFFCCLGILWGAAGCVTAPPAKPPVPVVTPSPSESEQYRDSILAQAKALEDAFDGVAAYDKYAIALTVDPACEAAAEGLRRTERWLQDTAQQHYQEAERLQKEGRYDLAHQQLLTALRLWPEHTEALALLTERRRLPATGYVVHKVEPGESLSQIAKKYYGDYRKFNIIADYNQLADASKIFLGQELKVPMAPQPSSPLDRQELARRPAECPTEASVSPAGQESDPPEVDQAAIYREQGIELFKKGDYEDAIVEFIKVLGAYPGDEVSADYCYQSYFQVAVKHFQDKDYLGAMDRFNRSLDYKRDCRQCHAYIKESEFLYKEMHYKMGMRYYGREQLLEAIKEWEQVQTVDPTYKKVDTLIKKAQAILKKLEEIKKDQT